MGGLFSRPRFYTTEQVEKLMGAKTNRSRAKMHADMFSGAVPEDRIGEAVHAGSIPKKLIARAAAWDARHSALGARERARLASIVHRHALPWRSEDAYGDATGFAFSLISEFPPPEGSNKRAKKK